MSFLPESAVGNGVWGPLTDTYGLTLTTASDGAGGIILTTPKFGSQTVTASQLQNTETASLVARICRAEDVATNWQNLVSHLAGIG